MELNEIDHFEWIENTYFHAWHFVYQQVQLTNWMGNIVAGVITFIVVTLAWPKLRHAAERAIGITALHKKLDAQHAERMAQATTHHLEAVALAKAHHEEHMRALRPTKAPSAKPTAPARTPRPKEPK